MRLLGPKTLLFATAAGFAAGVTILLVTQETDKNSRFSGGTFDGHACSALLQNVPPVHTPPPRFSGGSFDGVSVVCFRQNDDIDQPPSPRFSGGSIDGSCYIAFFQNQEMPYVPSARFAGDGYDGYATSLMQAYLGPPNDGSARFSGGVLDGYDVALILASGTGDYGASRRYFGGYFDGCAFALYSSSGAMGNRSRRFSGGSFGGYDWCALPTAIYALLDTDNDGLPDSWELQWYSDLTNTGRYGDSDYDGVIAFDEYVADTDPCNSTSFLGISEINVSSSNVLVTWHGGILATQFLERRSDLSPSGAPWKTVFTNLPPTLVWTNFVDAIGTNKTLFYRVRAAR